MTPASPQIGSFARPVCAEMPLSVLLLPAASSDGAVAFYTKGLAAAKAGDAGTALGALERARELAPTWGLPPAVLANVHAYLRRGPCASSPRSV